MSIWLGNNHIPERNVWAIPVAACVGAAAAISEAQKGESGLAVIYAVIAGVVIAVQLYARKKDKEENEYRNNLRIDIYNRLVSACPEMTVQERLRRVEELMFDKGGDFTGWWYEEHDLPEEN